MIKTFPFRLDIEKEYNNRMYTVNSNDLKTVKFTCVVTDNGIPLDLAGLTVRIAIRKPDKKAVWQDCTVTNAPKGEVEVVLESQAYIKKGEHEAELMLYKGTDTVAITQKFYYRAAEGIMNDKSLKSETVLGPIDEKLAEVEKTLKDIRENGTGIDAQARQDIESVTTQLAEKAKQTDLNQTNSNVSATNKRVDELVIGSGDANAEVTDAHVSIPKNKTFTTLNKRIEESETEFKKMEKASAVPFISEVNGKGDSLTGWYQNTVKLSTSNPGYFEFKTDTVTTPFYPMTVISGHKYYISLEYFADGTTPAASAPLALRNTGTSVTGSLNLLGSVTQNTKLSSILEATGVGNRLAFYRQGVGGSFYFKNLILIDLTLAFGAGNEPDKGTIETFLQNYPDSYFFGKEYFNLTNYIFKNQKKSTVNPDLINDIKGTNQSIVMNADNSVQKIVHKDNVTEATVREDNFAYSTNAITETRTLSTGETITYVYDLLTFKTEVR